MFACYFKWKPVCNGSKRGISVRPSNFRTGWKRRPSRDEGRLMAAKPFHHNLTVSYHSWKSTGASAVSGKSHLIPVTKRNKHKNSNDSEQNKSSDWGRVWWCTQENTEKWGYKVPWSTMTHRSKCELTWYKKYDLREETDNCEASEGQMSTFLSASHHIKFWLEGRGHVTSNWPIWSRGLAVKVKPFCSKLMD